MNERSTDFEYAIAGGGLSGLALASSICRSQEHIHGERKSLCLIEPRQKYEQDHIWSFWNNVQMDLNVPVKKQWTKWKVRYGKKTFQCICPKYPYCAVLAQDFYAHSQSLLGKSNNVDIFFGESLEQVEYRETSIMLNTNARKLSTRLLFDSRPPSFDPSDFKQDFFGLHIRTSQNVFDPDCVTLMDFSGIEMSKGFHFFYVLPFSATEALVESVYVGLAGSTQAEHRRMLVDYLKTEYGLERFSEIYVERGCLPMQSITSHNADRRHYSIGTRAGLLRPSTAYGFASIHVFSNQLASALNESQLPAPPEGLSEKSKILDLVLLNYLRDRPQDGPLLLSSLFKKVSPEILIRFLADRSSLVDDAAIFTAMPKKLELGAIMAKISL